MGSVVALLTVTSMVLQQSSTLSRSVTGAGNTGPDAAFRAGIRGVVESVMLALSVGGYKMIPDAHLQP